MGMVSEPHPKPKAQVPTQPAAAGAPPANDVKGKLKKEQNGTVALPLPPVPAVSSAKGSTQRQQYSSSQYRQLSQLSGVQQRHTCQQQQQAYYGHQRSPTTKMRTRRIQKKIQKKKLIAMKKMTMMKKNLIPVIILKINDRNIHDPWLILRARLVFRVRVCQECMIKTLRSQNENSD